MAILGKDVDPRAKLRHDLRTPLHQIIGYAELIEDEVKEAGQERFVADLQKVQAAARRALELVDAGFPPSGESASPVVFREALDDPPPRTGAVEAAPPPVRAPLAPVEPAGVSLLVVDDNELNRDMLSRRLGSRGFKVAVADDGAQALAMIGQQEFDLVLLDVMMPGLSGIDVLRRLRERFSESDLPVVMATARDTTEDVVEALHLGANDYVTKPLDFPVVLARVETQLALRRQKQEITRLVRNLELRNRFIQSLFGRYLSDEVVADLLASPEGPRIGGEQRRVTLLMSDLRGFTPLTEGLEPQQVLRLLNSYLGAMADVVLAHQGTVDEFVGDAILAIFGAPAARPDDAQRAVACAVAMQQALAALNRDNEPHGLPRLEMGIAVHTGDVIVGNIGSERRTKYGVVGSAVNHAGRIESFTVGGQVLISDATLTRGGQRRAGRGAVGGGRQGHPRADRGLRPARLRRRAGPGLHRRHAAAQGTARRAVPRRGGQAGAVRGVRRPAHRAVAAQRLARHAPAPAHAFEPEAGAAAAGASCARGVRQGRPRRGGRRRDAALHAAAARHRGLGGGAAGASARVEGLALVRGRAAQAVHDGVAEAGLRARLGEDAVEPHGVEPAQRREQACGSRLD